MAPQLLHHARCSDAISEADSGHAIDFGKCAGDDHTRIVYRVVNKGNIVGGVGEMVISLIDQYKGLWRKFLNEAFEIFARSKASRWIIRMVYISLSRVLLGTLLH